MHKILQRAREGLCWLSKALTSFVRDSFYGKSNTKCRAWCLFCLIYFPTASSCSALFLTLKRSRVVSSGWVATVVIGSVFEAKSEYHIRSKSSWHQKKLNKKSTHHRTSAWWIGGDWYVSVLWEWHASVESAKHCEIKQLNIIVTKVFWSPSHAFFACLRVAFFGLYSCDYLPLLQRNLATFWLAPLNM